ncbi:MAG TPA: hypothetical protein VFE47_32280 [Tepidisphaeraceae bacterium]|nr:hypothetical protein [Tepidisphaeraceae bacterium]
MEFHFTEIEDPLARIDELARFVKWWYGGNSWDLGASESELASLKMPGVLRRFYGFVREWPVDPLPNGQAHTGFAEGIIDPPEHKNFNEENGTVFFYEDTQGCMACYTTVETDDPPVLCSAEWYDEEVCASPRLSDFLLPACLEEVFYGGLCHDLTSCDDWWPDVRAKLKPLVNKVDFFPNNSRTFYLLNGSILISEGARLKLAWKTEQDRLWIDSQGWLTKSKGIITIGDGSTVQISDEGDELRITQGRWK